MILVAPHPEMVSSLNGGGNFAASPWRVNTNVHTSNVAGSKPGAAVADLAIALRSGGRHSPLPVP